MVRAPGAGHGRTSFPVLSAAFGWQSSPAGADQGGLAAAFHKIEASAPPSVAVRLRVIDIIEVRGDKAVAHWGVIDMAGAMAQMGAAPH